MPVSPSQLNGGLLVDKPIGPTSHDVVAIVRRVLQERRVGHTGTLDPLASGVLVLLIGSATRLSQFLVADEKEYVADIRLGIATPTYDAQGLDPGFRLKAEATTVEDRGAEDRGVANCGFRLQPEDLDRVLDEFRGTFMQTPPPHSAKKVAGVRAYKRARNLESVELTPAEVTVKELEHLEQGTEGPSDYGLLRLRLVVSSGFYVRSLAHDIGERLGCGAHLEALRRTRVGHFRVEDAADIDRLHQDPAAAASRLIPPNVLLESFPAVRLTADATRRAAHGNPVGFPTIRDVVGSDPNRGASGSDPKVRLLGTDGELVAVAERRADALLHPVVVLR